MSHKIDFIFSGSHARITIVVNNCQWYTLCVSDVKHVFGSILYCSRSLPSCVCIRLQFFFRYKTHQEPAFKIVMVEPKRTNEEKKKTTKSRTRKSQTDICTRWERVKESVYVLGVFTIRQFSTTFLLSVIFSLFFEWAFSNHNFWLCSPFQWIQFTSRFSSLAIVYDFFFFLALFLSLNLSTRHIFLLVVIFSIGCQLFFQAIVKSHQISTILNHIAWDTTTDRSLSVATNIKFLKPQNNHLIGRNSFHFDCMSFFRSRSFHSKIFTVKCEVNSMRSFGNER